MSLLFGSYPVNTDGSPTLIHIDASWPQTMAIAVYNESAYALNTAFSGNVSLGLTAYYADVTLLNENFNGNLTINPQSFLSTQAENNAPSSSVFIVTYGANDVVTRQLQQGLPTGFPISLPRLQAIGNNVTTSTGTSVKNDGNPSGTSVVEATVSGQSGSTVSLTNDGLLSLGVILAGVINTIIETATSDPLLALGIANHLVSIVGNFKVNGTSEFVGNVTNDGTFTSTGVINANGGVSGNLTGNVNGNVSGSAGSIAASNITGASLPSSLTGTNATTWGVNGHDILDTTTNANDLMIRSQSSTGGVHMQTAGGVGIGYHDSSGNIHMEGTQTAINFYWADGAKQSTIHGFSGSNSSSGVTVNHGCYKAPTMIQVTCNSGSSSGSCTMGVGNVTSSTCLVTSGAVLSGFYGEAKCFN